MDPLFNIYTDQLRSEQIMHINMFASPDFLDMAENEPIFTAPIFFKGQAYIANNYLIISLLIETKGQMPCSICNTMTPLPITIKNFIHTESLEQLTSSVFNYSTVAREEIILALPQFIECHNGKCPDRAHIAKYIKEKKSIPPHNFPFTDL
jgi:hypothetical protein